MFQGSPENEAKRCCRRFCASAETDLFETLDVVVAECREHLVEEIRRVEREVMRKVREAEPFEGLRGGASDFGVVREALKLKRLRRHVEARAVCRCNLRRCRGQHRCRNM